MIPVLGRFPGEGNGSPFQYSGLENSTNYIVLLLLLSTSVMSDSVRPYRRQPTRLPHPWDSPGKNTGVGCHYLLQCMKVKSESEVAQSCLTLSDPMDCSNRLLCPWDFPGKSTGVGGHCLLQTVHEGPFFSTPSPAIIICSLFNNGHSDRCEVVPNCSFDVYFSNN